MPRIKCPHCNHKPFRSNNGLQWHLAHIHGSLKHISDPFLESRLEPESLENNGIDNKQALQNLKREIEENANSRLDIFRRRDSWLSDRISSLERIIENRETL